MSLLLAWLLLAPPQASAQDIYVVDRFSAQADPSGLPKGWKPMLLRNPRHTIYTLESEANDYFVKATSSNTASGILKETPIRIQDYPILTWRWKVTKMLAKADVRKKSGDDYAARLYVGFHFDPEKAEGAFERWKYKALKKRFGKHVPKTAIIYIWDNRQPAGKVFDNAWIGNAKMVVVESGPLKMGRWITERRDVYEDYRRLFDEEPPDVEFVVLMTDTDNTHDSAVSFYDDIVFSK